MNRDLIADKLTSCPLKGCNYVYSNWADLQGDSYNLETGKFRLFRLGLMENDLKYIFFIKAPMQGVAFKLDKADLIDGMGIWQAQFSSCRIFNLRPSSGTVRGARVITDDHSTVERWVVEVKIVLSDGGGIEKKLDVKQIFYPDSYNSDPYKEYRCKMIPR